MKKLIALNSVIRSDSGTVCWSAPVILIPARGNFDSQPALFHMRGTLFEVGSDHLARVYGLAIFGYGLFVAFFWAK